MLDLAHRINVCTNCCCYVVEGCEPAHENGVESGKGFGIKAHDHRHAALCHACHAWYDQGNTMDPSGLYGPSKSDKAEMWNRSHKLTYDRYWQEGWISV